MLCGLMVDCIEEKTKVVRGRAVVVVVSGRHFGGGGSGGVVGRRRTAGCGPLFLSCTFTFFLFVGGRWLDWAGVEIILGGAGRCGRRWRSLVAVVVVRPDGDGDGDGDGTETKSTVAEGQASRQAGRQSVKRGGRVSGMG